MYSISVVDCLVQRGGRIAQWSASDGLGRLTTMVLVETLMDRGCIRPVLSVLTSVVRKLDGANWWEAGYHGVDGDVHLPESQPSKQVGYFMYFVNLTMWNFVS